MSRPRLLVTGGTGFLGKRAVPLLREKFEVDVLSRTGPSEVKADLTQWNAGLTDLSSMQGRYAAFIHLAGLYELTAEKVDCYQQNVATMGTALKLANSLAIPYFLNASSVAAAINSKLPVVQPTDLNFTQPFPDPYAESKALGETVLKNWQAPSLRGRINLRLGVLVGSTGSGEIERVDGPYYAAEALQKIRSVLEAFPVSLPLPGSASTRLPLVPVDRGAQAIVKFCEWTLGTKPLGYLSFHLAPKEGLGVEKFYLSALKHLGIKHRGVRLNDQLPEALVLKASKMLAKFPEEQLYYLLNFPHFDTSSTREILGDEWCPEFKSYEQTFWSGYENFLSHR